MKEPELIIEELPFDGGVSLDDGGKAGGKAAVESVVEGADGPVVEAADEAAGESGGESAVESGDITGEESGKSRSKKDALRRIKEQVSEDDDAISGTVTLRQIVGGDYLLALVRHYLWFIVLVVLLTCVYVGVRYQCQQDVIEISRLEKELVDAKYRAMSSSSNLTEMCRQSNVLKALSENEDNTLTFPEQPPYIVEVRSEE